ncbi:MAG: Glu-tRNA(Gln) amidotransferase subunit GatD [Thermoproteota archaeon]|nr:Glu-tRNA(Gln) amidotransferase subunit GatD [Thermoproteota archaeon]
MNNYHKKINLNHDRKSDDHVIRSQQILDKFKIKVGDQIKLITNKEEYSGIVMPRYESSNAEYLVIKLKSGYNVGLLASNILDIIKGNLADPSSIPPGSPSRDTKTSDDFAATKENNKSDNSDLYNLSKILLISTGGTIASKIDYRTGGVTSVLTASELYDIFPEISAYASIHPEFLFNEYSENLDQTHWTLLSEKVFHAIENENYDGIIISHGTDTMHYTSSALSFALQNLPIPVVFIGSQRSSDRPSSDAFTNLLGAIKFITRTKYPGIFVCMHHNSSDRVIACFRGTRVRKNHTSKRDAFKSLDLTPFALIEEGDHPDNIKMIEMDKNLLKNSATNFDNNNKPKKVTAKTLFDNRVFLLKFFPGFDPAFLENFLHFDYKVIILEGTGLGHVNKNCFPFIKKLIDSSIVVLMSSQCIFGKVSMTVYDTGRDLLDLGVISLSNMSPETMLVKSMWALKNTSSLPDFISIMKTNLSGEMSDVLPLVP